MTSVLNEGSDAHAVAGVKGWLLLLAAGLLAIGPLFSLLHTAGALAAEELRNPEIKALSAWQTYKTLVWGIVVAAACYSVYCGLGLLNRRGPGAVRDAKLCLWITGPVAAAIAGIVPPAVAFGSYDGTLSNIGTIIGGGIAALIWTLYLNGSVRVRNTYGTDANRPRAAPSSGKTPLAAPSQVSRQSLSKSGASFSAQTYVPESASGPSTGLLSTESATSAPQAGSALQANGLIDEPDNGPSSDEPEPAFDERQAYAVIAEEIDENRQDKGLWLQAFARSEGDSVRQKLFYIGSRIEELRAKHERQIVSNREARQQERASAERASAERASAERAQTMDPVDALNRAIGAGRMSEVREYLEAGVDLEQRNEFGFTPLEMARIWGRKDMTDLLTAEKARRSVDQR